MKTDKERFREHIKEEREKLLNDPVRKELRESSEPIMRKILSDDYPIIIEVEE